MEKITVEIYLQSMKINYLTSEQLIERHPSGGVTFLMRHAERVPIRKPGDVIFANLTENGIEQAHRFGAVLAQSLQIGLVNTSPLERCVNTGKLILEGAEKKLAINSHWWLFSPFLRVKHQNGRGIGMWPAQPANLPDAIYLNDRLEILARRIRTPVRPGEIYLYIAHDTTVLPFLAYLLGIDRVDMGQIPNYQEGIALVRRDGQISLDDPAYYHPA